MHVHFFCSQDLFLPVTKPLSLRSCQRTIQSIIMITPTFKYSFSWILTQACVMTASIELKSSESEVPLRGRMVKALIMLPGCIHIRWGISHCPHHSTHEAVPCDTMAFIPAHNDLWRLLKLSHKWLHWENYPNSYENVCLIWYREHCQLLECLVNMSNAYSRTVSINPGF